MKFIYAFVALIVAVQARPQDAAAKPAVNVVSSTFENNPDGYNFAYEQDDGQKRDEQASITRLGEGEDATAVLAIKGSYSFVGPDGQTYTVTYIADDKGFQPSAPFIPVA